MLADSPLACIRCARAAFDLSSALGRPIAGRVPAWLPAPQHAVRAQLKFKLRQAGQDSGHHAPVALAVSMPSLSDRRTMLRSPRSLNRGHNLSGISAKPVDSNHNNGVACSGVVQQRSKAGPLLTG